VTGRIGWIARLQRILAKALDQRTPPKGRHQGLGGNEPEPYLVAMHTVVVLALDKVIPFDLSTPIEVFTRTRLPDGHSAYRVRVAGVSPAVDAGAFTLRPHWGLDALRDADTIVLPGCGEPTAPIPDDVLDALRQAAAERTRIASICTGAFILAATGLLDGSRATTHWLATGLLADLHPAIDVDPDVLYVDNGQLLTSAGAAAGLDLCLHLIRRDHGSAVAADAARLSVMPLEREGGQAQFIVHDHPPIPRGAVLEPVLRWMEDNAVKDLTLDDIAAFAGMSPRTLNRRFREQTGTTPLQWLLRSRIRQAQYLLETTDHPVDRVAAQVGFGSPTAFRERFRRIVGTSPRSYRSAFHRATTD
jgi:transcriptional regulator GlxA family with amidase domain